MSTEAAPAPKTPDVATQSLARPTAVMAVGTALSRITGLGRTVAMAFALGVSESRLADSYNLANTLPNVIYELILGGVLTSVFIPLIIQELRTKEHEDAWRSVSALVSTSLVVLAGCTLLVLVSAPVVVDVFTQKTSGAVQAEQRELATSFLRMFSPQIFLYGFAAIAAGLLNAHGRFALPMFAPIVNNLVVIATFLTFSVIVAGTPTDASVNDHPGQQLLLGLGTTAGVLAMTLMYLPALRRLPGRIRMRVDFRHPMVRRLAVLSAWTIAYVVTNTLGFAVSFYLANGVQGGVTAYVTAFAFFQLPIGIAAVSIMTALVPRMSARHTDGDEAGFRDALSQGFRTTALLLLPATAALIVLAKPMIQVLLEHGVVRADSVDLVSRVLVFFAIGLVPFATYQLLMRSFYTRQDARTPALVNVAENVATVALDFALFPLMKIEGLALAHTLGYVIGCVVGGTVLVRRVGALDWGRIAREFAKALAAACVAGAVMLGVVAAGDAALAAGELRALAELVVGGVAGIGAFVLAARLLRAEDLSVFLRLLPGRG